MVAPLAGQAALAQSEPVPPDSWARRQEIDQLGEITPNVAADFDPLLGTPTFIRSTTAFLTRRSGRTPAQIVADFINDNPASFGVSLSGGNLAGAEQFTPATYRSIRDFETPSLGPTGVRHLTYQQTHNGQDIYGCLLTSNITGDGMLVNIGSRFVPEPANPISAPACDEANRTVRDIVAAACDEVGDARIADIVNLIAPEAVCAWDWKDGHAFQGVGETALWVRSVLHPVSATELVQAWVVRLPSNPSQDDAAWECIVKHSDLSVLSTHDLTMHYCQPEPVTYRVNVDDAPVPEMPGISTLPAGPGDSECVMRHERGMTECGQPLNDLRQEISIGAGDTLPVSPFGWLNEEHAYLWDHDSDPGTPPVSREGFPTCNQYNGGVAVQTCGNNAWVYLDSSLTPILGNSGGLDRTFKFDDPGSAEAVAAQVFFDVNLWHDRMYALGFDEAAGNCQAVNTSGSGVGGDPVRVVLSETDRLGGRVEILNGEFNDGERFVVHLYRNVLPSDPSYAKSTGRDRSYVFHELTHILSQRLHTGQFRLSAQGNGLSEGWSDYFAIALLADPADDPDASFPVASWHDPLSPASTRYYFGNLKRYPCTAFMGEYRTYERATNPFTYGYADPGPPSTPPAPPIPLPDADDWPHNAYWGSNPVRSNYFLAEIWTVMLIECRSKLSARPDLSFAQANELLMQLAVDGMKLNRLDAGFTEARDAILQADLLRHGGAHQPALWAAFARRGLGWGATGPSGTTAEVNRGQGITESMATPPAGQVSFFYPDGEPYLISTCGLTTIDVMVVSPGAPLTDVAGDATPDPCAIGLPATLPMVSPGVYRMELPPAPCRQNWEVWVSAGVQSSPTVDSARTPLMAGLEAKIVADNMSSNEMAWQPNPSSGAGFFERVVPVGGTYQPSRDHTPGSESLCWVTENQAVGGSGTSRDVDAPPPGVSLTSGPIAVLPHTAAMLEFWLWYMSNGPSQDAECVVEWLRDEVVNQTYSISLTPASSLGRWQRVRVVVKTGDSEEVQNKLRVRFLDPSPDSTIEGGLDDVRVSCIVECQECCDGDYDRSGTLDQDDVWYLGSVVAGGENPTCTDPDFNRDGNVDQTDIADLITYVGGGPCP
ncbi:MAG: M36 family metallopeptidase [Phycisphaerales bacterium]|nr:M36 family metallopeptidase [Phycisphaerales bacterium]